MGISRTYSLALVLVVLVAAACGSGDPEVAFSEALEQRIPVDLEFADESNTPCVKEKILAQHDRVDLEARGLGTEALLAAEGDLAELFGDRDGPLPSAVLSCVDSDERFADAVLAASAAPVSTTAGCVDEQAFSQPQQLGVVLYGDAIDIDDDLRDLVRDCMTEEDFATLFGLDQPDDLAAALVVDPLYVRETEGGDSVISDEVSSCVGAAVVEEIGVESLDKAGVSTEQPDVFHSSAEFSDAQLELMNSALQDCEAVTPMLIHLMALQEPEAGECAVEALGQSDRLGLLEDQKDNSNSPASGKYRSALNDCVTSLLDEKFGTTVSDLERRLTARSFAGGLMIDYDAYEMSRYESKCLNHRTELILTPRIVEELNTLGESDAEADAFYEANPDFLIAALDVYRCLNTDKFMRWNLTYYGISESSTECVFEFMDADARFAWMDFAAWSVGDEDPERLDSFLDADDEFVLALDQCATVAEIEAYYDEGIAA